MPHTGTVKSRGRASMAALIGLFSLVAAPRGVRAQDPGDLDSPIELEEIVISASGFEQVRINAPASITVLTAEELARRRTTSLSELLMDVEGIDVMGSPGKTGNVSVSMRGMPSDYTLILIDGRRQNSAGSVTPNGFGGTSFGFLPPPSAIERVEIIRGPMATLYGSDAMGGVVNIITKKVVDGWSGTGSTDVTVQQEQEFGNVYTQSASVNGPLVPNRLGLDLRGSLMYREEALLSPSGDFDEGVAISRRGPSPVQSDRYSVGGRLVFTPDTDHDLSIELDRSRQTYDNSEAQLGTLDDPETDYFRGYGPEQRFNRDQAVLAHTWRFGRGALQSSVMRNMTETLGRTLPPGTPGGPPGSGAPDKEAGAPRTLESVNLVVDSKATWAFPGHRFTLGGQFWDAEMIDAVALNPFTSTQWSLFAEDEWRFLPSTALTLGARYDRHSSFGSQLSPRAYLVWNAASAWTVKGGVSAGYKTPNVEQLQEGIIGFSGQGTRPNIGTPSLKPETSLSSELGVYYAAGGFSGNVSLFNNDFRDKITSGESIPNCTFSGAPNLEGCLNYGDFPDLEFFSQRVNVDEAVTRGVEVALRVPLSEILSLSGNYTFTHSEQRSGEDQGFPLTDTPAHMVNGSLRAGLGEGVSAWVRGEYKSSRVRSTSANPRGDAAAAQEALGDYRAYELFHLGGSYTIERVTLSATLYNVLNKDFLIYRAYQGTPTADNPSGTQYSNLYNNHQEGRRLWISMGFRF